MSSSVMYEPSHEPLGRAIAGEEEEEEDQEREKGDEEPLGDGERGGGERTVDARGPVAPDRWCDGCGSAEELDRDWLPEFGRDPPAKSSGRRSACGGELRLGREEEEVRGGRLGTALPHL
jgi:hypothetical protein